jgi:hypothetical protein
MNTTPFDGIQDAAFNAVNAVFATDASWTPSGGGSAMTGKVLLKEPTEEKELAGREFSPYHRTLEYKQGDFDGLCERVRMGDTESMVIGGQTYVVRTCNPLYDGKTFKALVELNTDL